MPSRIAIVSHRPALRRLLGESLCSHLGSAPIEFFTAHDEVLRDMARLNGIDVLIADGARTENFLQMISAVRAEIRCCRVLVITSAIGDYAQSASFGAGATGIVHELDELDDWFDCVRVVARGGVYQSTTCVSERASPSIASVLTLRETEILPLVCRNLSDAVIAAKLGISAHTVEGHRVALLRKLGVPDAAGLIALGCAAGVVAPPEVQFRSRERRSAGGARR